MMTISKNSRLLLGIISLLALIGIIDTAYLTYQHLQLSPACIEGTSCLEVLRSEYATLFNLPISLFGLIFYVLVLGLSIRKTSPETRLSWLFYLSLIASVTSIGLIGIQGVIINAWCPFCLLSASLCGLLFLISIILKKQNNLTLWSLPKENIGQFSMEASITLVQVLLIFFAIKPMISPINAIEFTPVRPQHTQNYATAIGPVTYQLEDINEGLGLSHHEILSIQQQQREGWLDERVIEYHAKLNKVSVKDLIKVDINNKVYVSDQQVIDFYLTRVDKLPENWDKIKPRVQQFLKKKEFEHLKKSYVKDLKKKYNITYNIPKSPIISIAKNPYKNAEIGNPNAKVKVTIFSDFQCPACKKAHENLEKWIRAYPKQLHITFRNFPLGIHKQADHAAKASFCALDQNKFLEMAGFLYEEQNSLSPQLIRSQLNALSIDPKPFNQCITDSSTNFRLIEDIKEGNRIGISSTPSFIINGKLYRQMGIDEIMMLFFEYPGT